MNMQIEFKKWFNLNYDTKNLKNAIFTVTILLFLGIFVGTIIIILN